MGSTSAGVPEWAGVAALANELRARAHRRPLGFMTDNLYRLASSRRTYSADFHDITQGDNALDSTIGFSADRGYDLASGLGTPDVGELIAGPGDRAVREPLVRRSRSTGWRTARRGTVAGTGT